MDKELDVLLKSNLLYVPDDFTTQVMINLEPQIKPVTSNWSKLQWLAFVGGGYLGLSQVLAYMFGIWTLASAG